MIKNIIKILIIFSIIILSFFAGLNTTLAKENNYNLKSVLIKLINIIDNNILNNKNFNDFKIIDINHDNKITFIDAILGLKQEINNNIDSTNNKTIKLINNQKKYWTNKKIHKPKYLKSIFDPVFKTKITRITGDPKKRIPNLKNERW